MQVAVGVNIWAWRVGHVETSTSPDSERLFFKWGQPPAFRCLSCGVCLHPGRERLPLANVSPRGVVPMLSPLCTGGKGSQVKVFPLRNIYLTGASRLGTLADRQSQSTQQRLFLHPGVSTSARHVRESAPTDAVHGSRTCDRG